MSSLVLLYCLLCTAANSGDLGFFGFFLGIPLFLTRTPSRPAALPADRAAALGAVVSLQNHTLLWICKKRWSSFFIWHCLLDTRSLSTPEHRSNTSKSKPGKKILKNKSRHKHLQPFNFYFLNKLWPKTVKLFFGPQPPSQTTEPLPGSSPATFHILGSSKLDTNEAKGNLNLLFPGLLWHFQSV